MASDSFGLVGTVIREQYRIDAAIGEGGFGVVYRGYHLTFEQSVAVKCLKVPGHFTEEAKHLFWDKFREEAKVLSKLASHPCVVRVLDFGKTLTGIGIEVPFMVLEWIDGPQLGQAIARRQRPYSEIESLELLLPVIDALAMAHDLSIAHRDIKPENLLMGPTPWGIKPKLLDFGIAKAMQEGETATMLVTHTSSGFHAFSPRYAAPEQFRPDLYGPSGPWTDVHALGLLLVEMVSGKPAIDGETPADFLIASTRTTRPTPRTKGCMVSDAFEQLCSQLLAMRPKDRPPDAGAVLRSIEAYRLTPKSSRTLGWSNDIAQYPVDRPPMTGTIPVEPNSVPLQSGVAVPPNLQHQAPGLRQPLAFQANLEPNLQAKPTSPTVPTPPLRQTNHSFLSSSIGILTLIIGLSGLLIIVTAVVVKIHNINQEINNRPPIMFYRAPENQLKLARGDTVEFVPKMPLYLQTQMPPQCQGELKKAVGYRVTVQYVYPEYFSSMEYPHLCTPIIAVKKVAPPTFVLTDPPIIAVWPKVNDMVEFVESHDKTNWMGEPGPTSNRLLFSRGDRVRITSVAGSFFFVSTPNGTLLYAPISAVITVSEGQQ